MEADLHRLLAEKKSKDGHYAQKLLMALQCALFKKGSHVFWGCASPFVDSLQKSVESFESGITFDEVVKDLSDFGWKEVEWSCYDALVHPEEFYCGHCLSYEPW